MAKPHRLSSREVAALVGSLSFGDTQAGDDTADVRPHVWGAEDPTRAGELHALRLINERFCRLARSAFLPMLRIQPRLSAFPPEVRTFDDYRDSQDNFLSLSIARIEELRGPMLTVIPPSFVGLLTDAYYGGAIRHAPTGRSEFTATEARVIEIVTDRINDALRLAWRDLMPITLSVLSREENMQFAAFVEGEETVVNCSFMVQLPGTEPAAFDILYPMQTLRPVLAQLRSRFSPDQVGEDAGWRARLAEALLDVPLRLDARLCETEVPLNQLSRAQGGADILPVTVPSEVTVAIAGRPMFRATPGDVAGRLSLSVTARTKAPDTP